MCSVASEPDMADAPILADGLAAYIDAVRRPSGPPLSLEAVRLYADLTAHRIAGPRPAGMQVTDSHVATQMGETAVRIYRPDAVGPQPAILYLHGGGFTQGSIESYDILSAALAEAAGASVVSVHYARLPESTPRATLAQCHDVLRWMRRNADMLGIDAGSIAVAGDSAGAFLATHLAVAVRDAEEPPLVCQLLCYGVYDLDPARPAYANSRDPVLSRGVIDAIIATYRGCDTRDAPPLPPPLALPDLSGLPPAILLGAEHDPMLEEGRAYAERLRAAGAPVTERVAPAMCHGFLRALRFCPAAGDEMQWLGTAFRDHLQHQKELT
ncbi:MAG: alpha/beta hydrolase [Alphaproteobacteria bacterium HGW-Alphaproteobacteria-16]|nr:MAG: alpha/beta hydrolase [Alphaproteobacteria bacterium HGW-Alphaproteobacteria-16]